MLWTHSARGSHPFTAHTTRAEHTHASHTLYEVGTLDAQRPFGNCHHSVFKMILNTTQARKERSCTFGQSETVLATYFAAIAELMSDWDKHTTLKSATRHCPSSPEWIAQWTPNPISANAANIAAMPQLGGTETTERSAMAAIFCFRHGNH